MGNESLIMAQEINRSTSSKLVVQLLGFSLCTCALYLTCISFVLFDHIVNLPFVKMGRVTQYNMTVKNSFIHFVDEGEQSLKSRRRSLSDFTGMSVAQGEKLRKPMLMTIGSDDQSTEDRSLDDRTTVMVRNIPNSYTSSSLVELFEAKGYRTKFDFVYLPIDFRTGVNLGYAFVNFVSNLDAHHFILDFDGFRDWSLESLKICEVSWADPYQGLEEHVERYRNSPVMHEKMPDEYKPRVYRAGVRVPFPEPTKRIRAPRMRPQRRP